MPRPPMVTDLSPATAQTDPQEFAEGNILSAGVDQNAEQIAQVDESIASLQRMIESTQTAPVPTSILNKWMLKSQGKWEPYQRAMRAQMARPMMNDLIDLYTERRKLAEPGPEQEAMLGAAREIIEREQRYAHFKEMAQRIAPEAPPEQWEMFAASGVEGDPDESYLLSGAKLDREIARETAHLENMKRIRDLGIGYGEAGAAAEAPERVRPIAEAAQGEVRRKEQAELTRAEASKKQPGDGFHPAFEKSEDLRKWVETEMNAILKDRVPEKIVPISWDDPESQDTKTKPFSVYGETSREDAYNQAVQNAIRRFNLSLEEVQSALPGYDESGNQDTGPKRGIDLLPELEEELKQRGIGGSE